MSGGVVVQSLIAIILLPLFSPQIREIEFWWIMRESIWAPQIFHPPFLTNLTPIKSIFFSLIFYPPFFIISGGARKLSQGGLSKKCIIVF